VERRRRRRHLPIVLARFHIVCALLSYCSGWLCSTK
jgi:hypothetical protein